MLIGFEQFKVRTGRPVQNGHKVHHKAAVIGGKGPRREIILPAVLHGNVEGHLTELVGLAVEEQHQREREAEEARLKAQREAVVADSIKQATVEAAASATNPKKATIITKKGMRMKVWVCSETDSMVSYKKTNSSKAAIFNMSKAKIKSIVY